MFLLIKHLSSMEEAGKTQWMDGWMQKTKKTIFVNLLLF